MPNTWLGTVSFAIALAGTLVIAASAATADTPAAVSLHSSRGVQSSHAIRYGTLQSQPEHAARHVEAGITVAQVGLLWSRYEPREGEFDAAYVEAVRRRINGLREAGMVISLGLGVQYPPGWVFEHPESRFINQFGDAYNEDDRSGSNGVNAVFSQAMREKQRAYFERVFRDFDPISFESVRLGGGYYGELCYPIHEFNGRSNCYWAFDPLAQGEADGLPPTVRPSPVPGWRPGDPSPDGEAARFADWYVESLHDYHDWQIRELRRHFDGWLVMLYPSWGLRLGQLEAAVAVNLDGSTSPERNGETQRGLEFHRFIAGLDDERVIVCSTWLDSDPSFGDDESDDPTRWSPGHYLASLAHAHPLDLTVWAENTGSGGRERMELSFERMHAFGISVLMWAFEPRLYDEQERYATIDDYVEFIRQYPPSSDRPASPQSAATQCASTGCRTH